MDQLVISIIDQTLQTSVDEAHFSSICGIGISDVNMVTALSAYQIIHHLVHFPSLHKSMQWRITFIEQSNAPLSIN
jgi:hypothetical protein